jgi:hypothetical protein
MGIAIRLGSMNDIPHPSAPLEGTATDNGYQSDAPIGYAETARVEDGIFYKPFVTYGEELLEISTKVGGLWVHGYPVNTQRLVEFDFGVEYIRMKPSEAKSEIARMQRWLQAVSDAIPTAPSDDGAAT